MAVPAAQPASPITVAAALRYVRHWTLGVLLLLVCGVPAAADDTVTLNFVNAEIDAVVKAVAEITGRNFVVDPKIKGTVNIISARPIPRSMVYPTLLSALRLQGVAAIESGGLTQLVLEADAKQHGSDVGVGRMGGGGDRLVTQVITLRNESAAQMVNVLRPLITPNNSIAAYPATNSLIITDYAENLRRIDKIISSLDQPPAGEPMFVTLRYASAIDLVPLINRLLVADAATGGQPAEAQQKITLVADPRSNSILLRSENAGRAARVKTLIEQLDTPGRPGGNMFIVYLKNAEAGRVAQTLRALLNGTGDTGFQGSTLTTTAGSIGSTMAGSAAGATNAAAGNPAAPNPFSAGSGGGGGGGGGGALGVTIQADTANNALVIMGPEPVYNNLRAIIDKLDVRRAQVYIEALIVEVSADKAAEFGIQWQTLTGASKDGIQGIGGTNFGARGSGNNIIDTSISLGSAGQGLNLGIINGSISIPGLGFIANLALLVRSLESNANANILSTPTLLMLDNEEARIIVGQNVPFITGQYATTGSSSTVQPFQTVERRDVGVLLRVKPQITEGGSVRLGIYQEVSRVESTSASAGPTLSKRALESAVVVDDKQIIVLGGLIQDSFTDNTDKLPYAGDIPIIGQLFRYDTRKRTKTNLLVFIKPTVVRTSSQGEMLTSERYDYIIGEQNRTQPVPMWFWNDPTFPRLSSEGRMPGTPGGTTIPPSGQPAPIPEQVIPLPRPAYPGQPIPFPAVPAQPNVMLPSPTVAPTFAPPPAPPPAPASATPPQ